MSGPQGSSTPAFVESSSSSSGQANGTQGGGRESGGSAAGTQNANGKGKEKGPATRRVPATFGKTKGSIWCVRYKHAGTCWTTNKVVVALA